LTFDLFSENPSQKFKFHFYLTRTALTLHEGLCTVLITSRSVLLRMRNVSDKRCRENQTNILCSVTAFRIRAFYEMWKNTVQQPGRPQMTVRSMRIASWIPKAPNTHSV